MTANPYVVFGRHLGYCNGCGEESELSQPCMYCEVGEIVPFADDPDPDDRGEDWGDG